MTSLYDPYPKTKIEGHQGELIQGWESILAQLQEKMEITKKQIGRKRMII